jgi:hypothetical protein
VIDDKLIGVQTSKTNLVKIREKNVKDGKITIVRGYKYIQTLLTFPNFF